MSETDPNKLHGLANDLHQSGVFTPEHVTTFVARYLAGDLRDKLDPVPSGDAGMRPHPGIERLSAILQSFNDRFGNVAWDDADRVLKRITEEIPERVAADPAYQNAQQNNDPVNARIELDKALGRVVLSIMRDSFRAWLADAVFRQTYGKSA